MSKYDFRDAKLENKDGTLAIGEDQRIINVVTSTAKETLSFKEEVEKSDLPLEKKVEVQEAIDFVEREVKGEKPNKTVIKSVMDPMKSGIHMYNP
jgi:anaerobic ribonucleoside-triphosphate reductase